jgi:hypothetical protein
MRSSITRYLFLVLKLAGLSFFGLVILYAIINAGLYGFWVYHTVTTPECLEIENREEEAELFHQYSGLKLPAEAQIIASCDNHHLDFQGHGEYYLVFDTNKSEINKYLQTTLWNNQWQQRPVPSEIISSISNTSLSDISADTWKSSDIWYTATGGGGENPYYSGGLIVIDPKKNRVFYSEWNP